MCPPTNNLSSQAQQSIDVANYNRESINLLVYLQKILMHWRLVVRATLAAFVISVCLSFVIPPTYRASTKVLPPEQDSSGLLGALMGSSGGMGGMAADLLGKGSPADLYVGILSSDAISDIIIDRFKLMEVYGEKYRIKTYKRLNENVGISVGKKDGIITIVVEDKNPNRSAEIANAYVEELGKMLGKLSVADSTQNRVYLEQRLEKAKSDLIVAEDALKNFQAKNKAFDIPEQAKGAIKGVAELEGQLAAEEIKLSSLMRVYTDSSQEIKNQKLLISNIKNQISKLEGNRIDSAVLGVGSVPDIAQQYLRLMRKLKIQETLFEMLTKQNEIAKLGQTNEVIRLKVIQSARVPDMKSKPRRTIIVLTCTISTFAICLLYILITDYIKSMSDRDRMHWNKIRKIITSN